MTAEVTNPFVPKDYQLMLPNGTNFCHLTLSGSLDLDESPIHTLLHIEI